VPVGWALRSGQVRFIQWAHDAAEVEDHERHNLKAGPLGYLQVPTYLGLATLEYSIVTAEPT
jgi:hypothetical protein